jgi:hypothetical protein
MKRLRASVLPNVLVALLLFAGPVAGQEEEGSRFRDPLDGKFDMSAHLASAAGFLPIVSPITEPAVNYGGIAVLAFLHRPKGWTLQGARDAFERGERQPPPSVSMVAGGYTFNDSWMVGGGHLGIWRGDRLRYGGFGGYGAFNLALTGDRPDGTPADAEYSITGWIIVQSLRWRLAGSPWFLGFRGSLSESEVAARADPIDDLEIPEQEARNGALGVTVGFDTRDNIFTPNRGFDGSVEIRRYDDVFFGDFEYWEGTAQLKAFFEVGPGSLGFRGKGMRSGEGVPFWALPAVGMRGVPARQYLGPGMVQGEAEYRWDLDRRWSLVGFGGVGWTGGELLEEDISRVIGAGGIGGRYLLARAFGVRAGIDLAWGPDGGAFYITVGSAFR